MWGRNSNLIGRFFSLLADRQCTERRGHVRTQQEGSHLQANKRVLTRNQTWCDFDFLDFQHPELWEKYISAVSVTQSVVFCCDQTYIPPQKAVIEGSSNFSQGLTDPDEFHWELSFWERIWRSGQIHTKRMYRWRAHLKIGKEEC